MAFAYKARENDIIENKTELEFAISNNLIVFFNAFLPKLVYELKMVASITTQDGSLIRGKVEKVRAGSYANGQPKYKNVYNKFAVLDISLALPGQPKKKLTRLVVAPVNIWAYNPTTAELDEIEKSIGKLIEIPTQEETILPAKPAPEPVPEGVNPLWWELNKLIGQSENYIIDFNDQKYVRRRGVIMVENRNRPVPQYLADLAKPIPLEGTVFVEAPAPALEPPTVPVVTPPAENPAEPVAPVLTLREWYGALGQEIPLFYKRAEEYERLGLGPRGAYLGTGEQNTKFLNALKAEANAKSE